LLITYFNSISTKANKLIRNIEVKNVSFKKSPESVCATSGVYITDKEPMEIDHDQPVINNFTQFPTQQNKQVSELEFLRNLFGIVA